MKTRFLAIIEHIPKILEKALYWVQDMLIDKAYYPSTKEVWCESLPYILLCLPKNDEMNN
jgi:hypothetical protein